MGVETMELMTYIFFRGLLPATLIVSAFLRISVVSLIWLLFFMVLPCIPKYSYQNWHAHKILKVYILLLLVTSTFACSGHIVYYVLQLTDKIEVTPANLCDDTNIMLMNIGYQSYSPDVVPLVLDRIRLIMPDFVVFLVTVVTTVLAFNTPPVPAAQGLSLSKLWRVLEPTVTTVCLLAAGSVAPSLVSGVYFVTFVLLCTLRAVNVRTGRLPHLKLVLFLLAGCQLLALYVYQFNPVNEHLPPESLSARLLGFVEYYDRNCSVNEANNTIVENPLHLHFSHSLIWGDYAFVFALAALYFSLALSARYMIKGTAARVGIELIWPQLAVRDNVMTNTSSPQFEGEISRNSICSSEDSEERENLLRGGPMRGNNYNTITVDGTVEDAAQHHNSLRSRHSSFTSTNPGEEETPLAQVVSFVTRLLVGQVYLLTLAVMMFWAITYISWMEFVLLVLVCFLCICPKAREASHSVAYPLVGYGTILVAIQYIYGLNLKPDELKEQEDIGMKREEERGRPVLIKALFLSVFWLHLRACLYQQENLIKGTADTMKSTKYTIRIYRLYAYLRHAILHYWPVVVYLALLGAALHTTGINIMRIVYLVFFSVFMFCYVVARKPLQLRILWLWYLLICYSMLCVILLYTYQFSLIQELWTDDVNTIKDIGMDKITTNSELFIQLLVPILVLLVVTIQLRVFRSHDNPSEDPPMEEPPTPIDQDEEEEEEEEEPGPSGINEKKRARLKSTAYMVNIAQNVTEQLREFWSDSKSVASKGFHISLALMEMHSPKFVSLALFFVCVSRVSVLNVVVLLVTVVTLPWPVVQYKLTVPIFCWITWEIFSQLAYQLYMVRTVLSKYLEPYTVIPCNNATSPPLLPYDCGYKDKSDMEWLGYYDMKTAFESSPYKMVWGYVLVIVLLVVQRLLVHYMKGTRSPHVYILREGVFPDFIFPNISRENAETTISLQLMYLINNFFVLFGKEIVYIVHVVVGAVRFDVYGLAYIILMGLWKNLGSRYKVKACMGYIVLINILIAFQYLLLLGFPPGLCWQYPWCGLQTQSRLSLLIWLYLPSTPSATNELFLLADFCLLLSLTRLWHVFQLQKLDDTLAGALDPSPGPDYADPKNKSVLNTAKLFIFTSLWWVTAAVLFMNAVLSISVFSAGYLIATFLLLWYNSSLLTQTKELLIKRWEKILIYAYFVVLLKILLQLPSCVKFSTSASTSKFLCPIADLLKLICLQKRPLGYQTHPFDDCPLNYSDRNIGLIMDALTFAFLMVQLRVFKSPYFTHAQHYLKVLIETSEKGAMIMKSRVNLRTKLNFEAEEKRLRHIKQHVAKLKEKHDSKQDFDFGTEELVQEAMSYWEEKARRERMAEEQQAMLYLTQEDLAEEDAATNPPSDEEIEPAEEEAGGAPDEEADDEDSGEHGSGEEGDGTMSRPRGGWLRGENSEYESIATTRAAWTPKPVKPDKPTEELLVEAIEFSHKSVLQFGEFMIAWLDDKSGDYRFTSEAIFNERYSGIPIQRQDNVEVLEEVKPSSPPVNGLIFRITTAFYYFCLARTEILCFFFMLLNHVVNASLISMFYPIIAFLWGMVAFPRPSGIFWYIIIVYCKASIVLKYIFQFNIVTWNHQPDEPMSPMWLPALFGLTKTDNLLLVTIWDLLILIFVFIHKSCLETAGIWSLWYNTLDDVEESDTDIRKMVTPLKKSRSGEVSEDQGPSSLSGGPEGLQAETSLSGGSAGDRTEEDTERGMMMMEDTVDFTMLAKLNFIIFFKHLTDKTKKDMPKDLYLGMLMCSLLAILVTFLCYSAFGKVEGQDKVDVSEIIATSLIPSAFLLILLAQFMKMIIDRIIYLKRSMIAKYFYQVLLVLGIHLYIFIAQPYMTGESFSSVKPWIVFYIFFCGYFTLSAFQIQAGYPRLKTDSIILRTYNYLTYGIYLGYLGFPFLWELEVLINWVCTETTLTLDYWIKYSDIKCYLFKLKCWQVTYESSYTLGEKQPAYMKYGIGGALVLGLILIIWFPLLFMSVVTSTNISNPPTGFSCSLSVSGLEPLVNVRVAQMPTPLTDEQLDNLTEIVRQKNQAYPESVRSANYTEYVKRQKSPDVVRLNIYTDSTTLWEVSPAAVSSLTRLLKEDLETELTLRFDWSITRDPESTTASKVVTGVTEVPIRDKNSPSDTDTHVDRTAFLKMLVNCDQSMKLSVPRLVPSFLSSGESGSSEPVFLFPDNITDSYNMKTVDLTLTASPAADSTKCHLWSGFYWSFNQNDNFLEPFTNEFVLSNNRAQFYIFSERVVSSQYQLIASYGVVGLYISVVLVIFKFIRLVLADSSTRIIFQEMPCPDLIMSLVSSTEMVRAQQEFVLEQVLFRKLLLLYRSPETLIVWTGRHRHLKEE
uniref:Piezo mechanosensor n=1 Tax=Hormiphora californensis TaxID=1403702 RepID=A0A1S6WN64_HORCA|nr:piezo mechanosensor [Hormiphora californensis]